MFLWLFIAGAVAQEAPPRAPAEDARITLERTMCLGECPDYKVTIDRDGAVTYEGRRYVRVKGRRTARIDPARVAALLKEAEDIGFFGLKSEYATIRNPDGTESYVTDLPTCYVTVKIGSRSKKVMDYIGSPNGLRVLERHIDEAAGTLQWVRIDEATVRQMARDGWRVGSREGRELLRTAILHDDVAVVGALVDAGADVQAQPNGEGPLVHSIYRSPEITRLLLRAGAAPDAPAADGTPLVLAACNGNAEAVDALLKAGANPNARDGGGRTGRQCAAANVDRKEEPPFWSDHTPPFVADYRRVVALLDEALARRREG